MYKYKNFHKCFKVNLDFKNFKKARTQKCEDRPRISFCQRINMKTERPLAKYRVVTDRLEPVKMTGT